MINVCQQHYNCTVAYEGPACPVCSELRRLDAYATELMAQWEDWLSRIEAALVLGKEKPNELGNSSCDSDSSCGCSD